MKARLPPSPVWGWLCEERGVDVSGPTPGKWPCSSHVTPAGHTSGVGTGSRRGGREAQDRPVEDSGSVWLRGRQRQGSWGLRYGTNALGGSRYLGC